MGEQIKQTIDRKTNIENGDGNLKNFSDKLEKKESRNEIITSLDKQIQTPHLKRNLELSVNKAIKNMQSQSGKETDIKELEEFKENLHLTSTESGNKSIIRGNATFDEKSNTLTGGSFSNIDISYATDKQNYMKQNIFDPGTHFGYPIDGGEVVVGMDEEGMVLINVVMDETNSGEGTQDALKGEEEKTTPIAEHIDAYKNEIIKEKEAKKPTILQGQIGLQTASVEDNISPIETKEVDLIGIGSEEMNFESTTGVTHPVTEKSDEGLTNDQNIIAKHSAKVKTPEAVEELTYTEITPQLLDTMLGNMQNAGTDSIEVKVGSQKIRFENKRDADYVGGTTGGESPQMVFNIPVFNDQLKNPVQSFTPEAKAEDYINIILANEAIHLTGNPSEKASIYASIQAEPVTLPGLELKPLLYDMLVTGNHTDKDGDTNGDYGQAYHELATELNTNLGISKTVGSMKDDKMGAFNLIKEITGDQITAIRSKILQTEVSQKTGVVVSHETKKKDKVPTQQESNTLDLSPKIEIVDGQTVLVTQVNKTQTQENIPVESPEQEKTSLTLDAELDFTSLTEITDNSNGSITMKVKTSTSAKLAVINAEGEYSPLSDEISLIKGEKAALINNDTYNEVSFEDIPKPNSLVDNVKTEDPKDKKGKEPLETPPTLADEKEGEGEVKDENVEGSTKTENKEEETTVLDLSTNETTNQLESKIKNLENKINTNEETIKIKDQKMKLLQKNLKEGDDETERQIDNLEQGIFNLKNTNITLNAEKTTLTQKLENVKEEQLKSALTSMGMSEELVDDMSPERQKFRRQILALLGRKGEGGKENSEKNRNTPQQVKSIRAKNNKEINKLDPKPSSPFPISEKATPIEDMTNEQLKTNKIASNTYISNLTTLGVLTPKKPGAPTLEEIDAASRSLADTSIFKREGFKDLITFPYNKGVEVDSKIFGKMSSITTKGVTEIQKELGLDKTSNKESSSYFSMSAQDILESVPYITDEQGEELKKQITVLESIPDETMDAFLNEAFQNKEELKTRLIGLLTDMQELGKIDTGQNFDHDKAVNTFKKVSGRVINMYKKISEKMKESSDSEVTLDQKAAMKKFISIISSPITKKTLSRDKSIGLCNQMKPLTLIDIDEFGSMLKIGKKGDQNKVDTYIGETDTDQPDSNGTRTVGLKGTEKHQRKLFKTQSMKNRNRAKKREEKFKQKIQEYADNNSDKAGESPKDISNNIHSLLTKLQQDLPLTDTFIQKKSDKLKSLKEDDKPSKGKKERIEKIEGQLQNLHEIRENITSDITTLSTFYGYITDPSEKFPAEATVTIGKYGKATIPKDYNKYPIVKIIGGKQKARYIQNFTSEKDVTKKEIRKNMKGKRDELTGEKSENWYSYNYSDALQDMGIERDS